MALPEFSMRQLLEAGVHFGHQAHRWNPKMDPYIFGKRNNIHILDLSQTVPLMHQALKQVSDTVARGGRVLFVGTKRTASEAVADAARRSAQYYVNARWLGGMLTNWKTISNSIKRLRELEELLTADQSSYTKKELLNLTRERDKLERALGGIKDMGGTPDLIFVIDTNKEAIAIQEAKKLKIPVCAVLDSNSSTDNIDFPIPGNDDASRAVALYCDLIAKACIDGIARQQGSSGVDLGAQAEAPQETVLNDVSAAASSAAAATVDAASTAAGAVQETAASVMDAVSNIATAAATGVAEAVSGDDKAAAPMFTAPAGDADDLKTINGIGPVAETQLNEQGITTFAQIAALTDAEIEKIDANMPFSAAQISDWKAQAAAK
ncbi:30S ribosomal protein S2 [Ahrensia sp. R2A130]|uniref:30S ribosomal protein S2 n=1 Tax=Ahrensia sp. R2A130 TaxID=744979 RepID=UPI0001E0C317|nr:30S ribosomal protein S2 [Ahrensia sp. R2A130]EFL90232.1 30S ribosomal protein S2 [Ahrensia sp. R2A130]